MDLLMIFHLLLLTKYGCIPPKSQLLSYQLLCFH